MTLAVGLAALSCSSTGGAGRPGGSGGGAAAGGGPNNVAGAAGGASPAGGAGAPGASGGAAAGGAGAGGATAATGSPALDQIVFGDARSEAAHGLAAAFGPLTDTTTVPWDAATPAPSDPSATGPSDVVTGGLGQPARRLLPRTPNGDVYGGQVTFTMAVDPIQQNYFTLKMWGGDGADAFLILNVEGKEIGNRHSGGGLNEDPLYFLGTGWYPGRFFYRTLPLPLPITHGHTSATITIRSLGSMYIYAPIHTYVPQYQHIMNGPSPGLYVGSTHVGTIVDTSDEVQGTAPNVPTPRTTETEAGALASAESAVNSAVASKLAAAPDALKPGDIEFLARAYDARENQAQSWITYPSGKSAAALVTQVIAAIDAQVTAQSADPTTVSAHGNDSWGGYFGPMGNAIRILWPQIQAGGTMTTTVAYGGAYGTVTRQAGWAAALRASIDFGRINNRRTIGNQSMYAATATYYANRGLLLVDSTRALNESEALRYVHEAWGLAPWMGNDQATGGTDAMGGGPVPTRGTAPYGPNWFMCTTKGTTKDGDGFVGSDYGEVATWGYRLALDAHDTALANRAVVMARARAQFRYPGVDDKGFAVMMGTDPIGVRNNTLPSHIAYLGRYTPNDFLMVSQGAQAVGNDLVGYFQQGVNDGQAYRNFSATYDLGNTVEHDPYLPQHWALIKALPQTNVKLPATSGQPDFAWVDEENMAVAAKHGEERFYANLYWRQPMFINGLAKVFHLTPTTAHLVDAMIEDVRFRPTGKSITTSASVDAFLTPPDKPVEAYSGMTLDVALRSDLTAVPPTNRDAGRGTGYTFRYGHWLVGINAHHSDTYTVRTPADFSSATDLTTHKVVTAPVVLAPKSSVVFYLPSGSEPNPPPARSLHLGAVASAGKVTLTWNLAAGATSTTLLRATTAGGPYSPIQTGITAASAVDTTAVKGTTYYYVVTSISPTATSGYSPEASATAM